MSCVLDFFLSTNTTQHLHIHKFFITGAQIVVVYLVQNIFVHL